MSIEYTEEKRFTVEQVEALFKSVGWESAQWPERLFKALQHSDTVISAWDGGHLVGLVRVLDDTEMVAYMHWVLVDPAYHGSISAAISLNWSRLSIATTSCWKSCLRKAKTHRSTRSMAST